MKFVHQALAMASLFLMHLITGPRAFTRDVAFPFRTGAGFPGDVTRSRPFSVVPGLLNVAAPPAAYGNPVLVGADGISYRGISAADGSATPAAIAGVLVRLFPTQQQTGGMTSALGSAAPPLSGVADFLTLGFMMVKLPAGATVVKGGQVFVWAAASSGSNVQGQPVAASSTTNTYTVTNARFVGPADANGNVEIEVWPSR